MTLILHRQPSAHSSQDRFPPTVFRYQLFERRPLLCLPMLNISQAAGHRVSSTPSKIHTLTTTITDGKPPPRLHEEMRALEHTITLFLSTLVPINQLDAVLPEEKHSVITAYTLAHSATIHLHRGFALEDSMSFDHSSRASRACIAVIKYISERDFAFLDPIIGV